MCPCLTLPLTIAKVMLTERMERAHFRSKVLAMKQSGQSQRDFGAFGVSAMGETSTSGFRTRPAAGRFR